MKNSLKLSLIFFVCSLTMGAQGFEITPQFGYQINSKLNYNGGYIKIPGNTQYGITGSYNVGSRAIEFSWTQQNSEIKIKDVLFIPYEERNWGDVTINHYQFGSIQYFGNDDDLRPFLGASVGWSTFNPENDKYNSGVGNSPPYLSSTSTFTFGISGGIKYMFNNHIGLRVQSQLLMPVYGGAYYGYGYGYSKVMAMLNFSGGLIFAFGD